MAPFFFTSDEYLQGVVHANYTSGAPVRGNLTLKATITPIKDYNRQQYQQGYRPHVVEKYFYFVSHLHHLVPSINYFFVYFFTVDDNSPMIFIFILCSRTNKYLSGMIHQNMIIALFHT